jgi:hypothetical protein
MTRYATTARDYFRDHLPDRYSEISEPEEFRRDTPDICCWQSSDENRRWRRQTGLYGTDCGVVGHSWSAAGVGGGAGRA